MSEPIHPTTDPKILDIIIKRAYGNDHYYVVVDQPLKYVYTRVGDRFNGKHGDFYDFLAGSGRKGEAFAGRSFDIQLDDGTKFHCQGDVWAVAAPKDFIPVIHGGFASLEQLQKCYVFCSGNVAKSLVDAWLATNQPTDDYYKYDPTRKKVAS